MFDCESNKLMIQARKNLKLGGVSKEIDSGSVIDLEY